VRTDFGRSSTVPEIFISYRVQDQPVYAALLDRELGRRFGAESVFLAPRSIRLGDDFADALVTGVRSAAVLLAVIGGDWSDPPGLRRRYGGVDDWVRREIAEAFAHGIRVIPVLVGGAELPVEAELPADVLPLARCQSVRLNDDTLISDVDDLGTALAPLVESRLGITRRHVYELASPTGAVRRVGIVPGGIHGVRDVDVWVNSENTDLQMSRITEFSVSAIIRYLGSRRDAAGAVVDDVIADELRAAIDRTPVAPGTAVVTGPGALAASNNVRHVIHVAAVHGEPGAGFRPVRDLGRCVLNALAAADALAAGDDRVRTILFPMLGTGVAGGPPGTTAQLLVTAAIDHLVKSPDSALATVWFLAYRPVERHAVLAALAARPELTPLPEP
jgi:O-acetyl-ADP-ribose deacetylase (regulator of RNase III)